MSHCLEANVDNAYSVLRGTQLGTAEHTEAAAAYNEAVDALAEYLESKKAHTPVMAPIGASNPVTVFGIGLTKTGITTVDQVPEVVLAVYGD